MKKEAKVKATKTRAAAEKIAIMAQHGDAQEVEANNKVQAAVPRSRWETGSEEAAL